MRSVSDVFVKLPTCALNVDPLEVERVIERHPAIGEAAVVGVADRRWGQTVGAILVAVDPLDPPPAATALASPCRSQLAWFKVPIERVRAPSLPRNAAGKLLRHNLAAITDKEEM